MEPEPSDVDSIPPPPPEPPLVEDVAVVVELEGMESEEPPSSDV